MGLVYQVSTMIFSLVVKKREESGVSGRAWDLHGFDFDFLFFIKI